MGRPIEAWELDELARSGERPIAHRDSGIHLAQGGPAPLPSMDVFGVPVNVAPLDAVRAWLLHAAQTRGRLAKIVHFAGARSLGRAWRDVEHRSVLARGDLILGEGASVSAYARLATAPADARFDAVATLARVFEAASPDAPLRVFLLGGERGRAERAAQAIRARFPGVRVVGASDGSRHGAEDVNEACADVLLVGGPRAEAWVDDNVELLDVGVVASVGDAIDALGGDGCRAPRATPPLGPLETLAFLVRAALYITFRTQPRAFT